MKNKHILWILLLLLIIAIVGVVGFSNSNKTPAFTLTGPNNTDSNKDPVSSIFSGITGGSSGGSGSGSGGQNPTTPETKMKPCPTCSATGVITCPSCNGVYTWKECPNCHDIVPNPSAYTGCGCTLQQFGYYTHYVVKTCSCGDGKITCPDCNGAKQVPA